MEAFSGFAFSPVDQFVQVPRPHRFPCKKDKRNSYERRDRREIIQYVVRKRIQSAVEYMRAHVPEVNRVAIGRRVNGAAETDASGRPGDIFDDNRLSKVLSHPLGDDAAEHISRAALGKRNDHGDRARRIGFRPRDVRHGRESGSTGCQMQKSTAVKFHGVPSRDDPKLSQFAHIKNGLASACGPARSRPGRPRGRGDCGALRVGEQVILKLRS
jgi:hypothetical protein